MKQVEEFTYVGTVITSNRKLVQGIERRRAGATRVLGCCDGDYGVEGR